MHGSEAVGLGGDTRTIRTHERRTWMAAGVNIVAVAVEVSAGLALQSAGLLGEGLHAFAHVAALGLAGGAYVLSRRSRLYGRQQTAEAILDGAGLLNALLLMAIAVTLLAESWASYHDAAVIPFAEGLGVGAFGLLISIINVTLLGHTHVAETVHDHDLNFVAIYLHMVGDLAVGVLAVAGICLGQWLHWHWADAAAGLASALLIIGLSVRIIRRVLDARRARVTGHAHAHAHGG